MKILVIAPHPDDETLGCGGAIFRHKQEGDELYWGIITEICVGTGWSEEAVKKRDFEIAAAAKKYDFSEVFNFGLPTVKIDTLPMSELVDKLTKVFAKIEPEIIYIPFVHDVHTDHQITAKALQSTLKWFRHPYLKKVLMYETLSETEFNFIEQRPFKPNVFIDITNFIQDKIDTMKIYQSELGNFPFPRSVKNMRSLAFLRGSQSGYKAAEAFELVFERK
jgi:N-acetylglucosamine malate deacetylase 1